MNQSIAVAAEQPLVWITGASQGIGAALALEYAARGWRVAASARNRARLQQVQRRALPLAGSVEPFPLDVREHDQHQLVLEQIEERFGPIRLAILNAGSHRPQSALEFDSHLVRELMELNLMGVANGLEVLIQRMLSRSPAKTASDANGATHHGSDGYRGTIAVVASLAGYRGLPNAAAYGASKAALINLCEALRLELADTSVRLQLINPGFVKTPLTDRNEFRMPFLIEAEQAAREIADGLETERFEIRLPGLFGWVMALLRQLPYGLYFPLVRRLTGV
ncbi:SDR family NAD(P)-dependent oxidoreductase [Motiliproteus coralliicola]|uniref:SDR family NAD(P)-dependent oxidoreductase n=1 Tax=Motiliproteus coralliicola TaxID=2283196 RepID=A0A369WWE7_9GAMM|nr:SDR family NAD(P)-dependent oxidoreductase [Motiliproteus coralliicola]RDE24866.1 SDR family NAD(P)-dependent oxidoreductase [Motiliproteus coralliicola]